MTQSAADFLDGTTTAPATGTAAPLSAADFLEQQDGNNDQGNSAANPIAALQGADQTLDNSNPASSVVKHENPPLNNTEAAIRQTGLTSRDLLETAVSPLTGLGDLANSYLNAVSSDFNGRFGTKIPQLGMPSQTVDSALTKLADLPQPENTSEKVGSALTRLAGNVSMMGENLMPTAKALYSGATDLLSKEPPATSAQVKQIANSFYKQANDNGGILTPQFTNNFLDAAEEAMPQTSAGKIVAGENPTTQLVARLQALRNQPLTLQAAQEIDEHLGDLIDNEHDVTGLSKQGKRLVDIQSTFRDMIKNAGPDDIVGGQDGFDALNNGRQAWSQAAKMSDVERIMTRAQGSENPDTVMRSSVRTMMANPTRTRGWSPDELQALSAARNKGALQSTLKVMGSKLIPIIAGGGEMATGNLTGGIVSGIGADLLTSIPRKMSQNMQANRLQNVLNVLGSKYPALSSLPSSGGSFVPASASAIPALSALSNLRQSQPQQQGQ